MGMAMNSPKQYNSEITATRRRILFLAIRFPDALHAQTRNQFRSIVGGANLNWTKIPSELQFRTAIKEARKVWKGISI